MAAPKLEVHVRHCCCCGLTPGTFLIGIYSLLLYALLTGLAGWALSETAANGDNSPIYEKCQREANSTNSGGIDQRVKVQIGSTTMVVEDSSSYHCSLGMYTEEMKFAAEGRTLALLIALCIYIPLILASVLLLLGVCLDFPWLLVPWLVLMPLDIIRGLASTVLVFIYHQGHLARIATGIFFLGLQFLHISLWILVLAEFLRMRQRRRHHVVVHHSQYDSRQRFPSVQPPYGDGYYGPEGGSSSYAYSPQSGRRIPIEEGGAGGHAAARRDRSPRAFYDNRGAAAARY